MSVQELNDKSLELEKFKILTKNLYSKDQKLTSEDFQEIKEIYKNYSTEEIFQKIKEIKIEENASFKEIKKENKEKIQKVEEDENARRENPFQKIEEITKKMLFDSKLYGFDDCSILNEPEHKTNPKIYENIIKSIDNMKECLDINILTKELISVIGKNSLGLCAKEDLNLKIEKKLTEFKNKITENMEEKEKEIINYIKEMDRPNRYGQVPKIIIDNLKHLANIFTQSNVIMFEKCERKFETNTFTGIYETTNYSMYFFRNIEDNTNEKLYVKNIIYSLMPTDMILASYSGDDYSFLEKYTENVQNALKKQIKADRICHMQYNSGWYDGIYDKLETIEECSNVLDFLNNPPDFLKDDSYELLEKLKSEFNKD